MVQLSQYTITSLLIVGSLLPVGSLSNSISSSISDTAALTETSSYVSSSSSYTTPLQKSLSSVGLEEPTRETSGLVSESLVHTAANSGTDQDSVSQRVISSLASDLSSPPLIHVSYSSTNSTALMSSSQFLVNNIASQEPLRQPPISSTADTPIESFKSSHSTASTKLASQSSSAESLASVDSSSVPLQPSSSESSTIVHVKADENLKSISSPFKDQIKTSNISATQMECIITNDRTSKLSNSSLILDTKSPEGSIISDDTSTATNQTVETNESSIQASIEKKIAQPSSSTQEPRDQKVIATPPVDTKDTIVQSQGSLDSEEIIKDSNFMSFEEWKKKRVGDDPNPPRSSGNKKVQRQSSKSNGDINLNGPIGEEMEIELSMFSSSSSSGDSEDQGGKLYKDKFNFASFDCAATIVKTNSEAKGASAVLNENKDTYLLNECSAPNKFIIIELCEDILVSEILIGNYEFFSSMFHKVRFSVSDRFPVPQGGWKVLGEFEAGNLRNLQTFTIKNPLIWAKFLRVEVLSVYGNEFYCPITTVQVHGTTMIEQFKMDESGTEENSDSEEMDEFELEEDSIMGFKLFNQSAEFGDQMQQLAKEYSVPSTSASKKSDESDKSSDKKTPVFEKDTSGSEEDEGEDDCRVTPYLGLEKFLEELNPDDFCFPDNDPGLYESIEVESRATVPASSSEPVTQESIYKNLAKRLALLESNATLSLLYIEEQSRILSSAFDKLEQRQSSKFEQVISSLNSTIYEQIALFNTMHVTFTQRAVSLLNLQAASNNNVLDSNAKQLNELSQQLTNQRRLGVMNTIIIVSLLVYIVITRDTYIEADFIENIPTTDVDHHLQETYPLEVDGQVMATFANSAVSGSNYPNVAVTSNSPSSSEPGSPGSSIYYRKRRSIKGLTNLFFTDKNYTGRTYSVATSLRDKDLKITLDQVDSNDNKVGPLDTDDVNHTYDTDNDYISDDEDRYSEGEGEGDGDCASASVMDNGMDQNTRDEDQPSSGSLQADTKIGTPQSEVGTSDIEIKEEKESTMVDTRDQPKSGKESSIGKSLKRRISKHKFL